MPQTPSPFESDKPTEPPREHVHDPIRAFCSQGRDILDLAQMSESMLEAVAKGTVALNTPGLSEEAARAFALRQYEQGYPLLVQQALVTLWGIIETTVMNVCMSWLKHHPEAACSDAFSRLRIKVGEFLGLDEVERTRMLVEELDRSLADKCPAGIERFEALLSAVGLTGDVEARIRKALVELYQIRNLYVHNGGVADRHFKRVCPWRREAVGEPVGVSSDLIGAYSLVVAHYAGLVQKRLAKAGGSPPVDLAYPDAEPVSTYKIGPQPGQGMLYAYSTPDGVNEVLGYYTAKLAGWRRMQTEFPDGSPAIGFESPDGSRLALLKIERHEDHHFTLLGIYVLQRPESGVTPEPPSAAPLSFDT
jgi:hypothetical protein